jgi:redox-sensitive bicupin YhaK (pirin superfamily)
MTTKTPVFNIQRAADRAHFDHGWLETYHAFSFAEYVDRHNMHWGALRVLNDDFIAAGQGFPTHPHSDMEIVTYVLSGELEHQDDMGNRGVVGPGGIQYMSAGTGVRHSEFNRSQENPLHLVQMWVVPAAKGLSPQYGQQDFTLEDRLGRWLTVASGIAGVDAPIRIGQAATFSVARLEGGSLEHSFSAGQLGFVFVADGEVVANGQLLGAGDAVRIGGLEGLTVSGAGELLLWDLPELSPAKA